MYNVHACTHIFHQDSVRERLELELNRANGRIEAINKAIDSGELQFDHATDMLTL